MARPRSIPDHALLDAADAVVRRDGAGALSFDALAREAGVSKGAVTNRFRTKVALMAALVERAVERYAGFVRTGAVASDAGQRADPREALAHYVRKALEQSGDADPDAGFVLAAAAHDPSVLTPLRRANHALHSRFVASGVPASRVSLVLMAVDGIWLSELLGISPLRPDERSDAIERIIELAKGS